MADPADDWQEVEDWEEVQPQKAGPASPLERLRASGKPPPKDPGYLSTMGHSLLSGFFKGGADEAIGAVTRAKVGTPMPGATWRQSDGSAKPLETAGDAYRAGRDTERETLRGAQEHHPVLSFLGNVAGDVGSDLVASGIGVPGVGSMPYNVLTGGLSGLLSSDADLTPEKATKGSTTRAAASTAIGAGLGYVMPKVGAGLARVTPTAMRALRTLADNLAVSQGRRVLLNGADSLSSRLPTSAESVLEAIDSGAILPGGTTQGAFQRLERLADERGAAYGAILEELERQGVRGPDAEVLARQLAERGDALLSRTGADKAVPNVFLNEAANLQSMSREAPAVELAARVRQALQGVDLPPDAATPDAHLGLGQAEAIKRALQQSAKYGRVEETPVNEARREVASHIRQAIEDEVETAGRAAPDGSDVQVLAESFVPVKQRLGRTLEARNAAERGAQRVAQRRGVSLSDYVAAGMGSGITEKLSLGTLNNLMRNRGTSAAASGARGVARLSAAGARYAMTHPESMRAGGSEAGALLGRQSTSALAELLGLVDEGPQSDQEAALIEALRRRKEAP